MDDNAIQNIVDALKMEHLDNMSEQGSDGETDLFGHPVDGDLPDWPVNDALKPKGQDVEGLNVPLESEGTITGTGEGPEI
jgi:hypothetical protein